MVHNALCDSNINFAACDALHLKKLNTHPLKRIKEARTHTHTVGQMIEKFF